MKRFLVLLAVLMSVLCLFSKEYKMFDSSTGNEITIDELASRIVYSDVVFFGENHSDSLQHYIEQETFKRVLEIDSTFVLAMEMFERDSQDALDKFIYGEYSFEQLDSNSRLWKNYLTDYSPLVNIAKNDSIKVIATSLPRKYVAKVIKEGLESVKNLPDYESNLLARETNAINYLYKSNFISELMSQDTLEFDSQTRELLIERMFQANCLKDDTMAESIFDFLEYHHNSKIFHINGSFHSRFGYGIPEKLQYLNPLLKKTIISPIYIDYNQDIQWHTSYKGHGDFTIVIKQDSLFIEEFSDDKGEDMKDLSILKHKISFIPEPNVGLLNASDEITFSDNIGDSPIYLSKEIAVAKVLVDKKEVEFDIVDLNDEYNKLLINMDVKNITLVYIYKYPLLKNKITYIALDEYQWHPFIKLGEKSNFEVSAIAPNKYKFIAPGNLTISPFKNNTIYYTWKPSNKVNSLKIVGDLYISKSFQYGDTKVTIFCYENEFALIDEYEYAVEQYFNDYTSYFGPFAFDNLSIVQSADRDFKYYENVLLVDNSVFKSNEIFTSPGVLGHDLARMWINSRCQWDKSDGNWTEILANFISNYYWLEKNRAPEAPMWRKDALEDITAMPLDEFYDLYNFELPTSKFDAIMGFKVGAMLLYYIKDQAGEYGFFNALNTILDNNNSLSGREFFTKLTSLTKLPNLNNFIDDIYPINVLVKSAVVKDGMTRVEIIQNNKKLKDFVLDVKLINEENFIVAQHRINKEITSLEFAFEADEVILDPEYKLYRRLSAYENNYRLRRTFLDKPLCLVQKSADNFEDIYSVPNTLKKNGVELSMFPIEAINSVDWRKESLLFMGEYTQNPLFPLFAERMIPGFAFDEGFFEVKGKVYNEDEYSLIMNMESPFARDKSVSFWLWNDENSIGSPSNIFNFTQYSWVILKWNGLSLEEVDKGALIDNEIFTNKKITSRK